MRIVLLVLIAAVAGCSSVKSGVPAKTATEQVLVSTAADRAAGQLAQGLRVRGVAFLDTTYVPGDDNRYAISALRHALLRNGVRLTNDRNQAESIVEVRIGAMSTDEKELFVGLPDPRSLDSTTPATVVLYRTNTQEAVAKLAAFVYDAHSGDLISAAGPLQGSAKLNRQEVAPGISWESKSSDR